MKSFTSQPDEEVFWKIVVKIGAHWLWMGYTDRNGYGHFNRNYKTDLAHKYSYEKAKGPVPPGFELHHTCPFKRCVNPDCLEVVPSDKHPGGGAELQRKKTHCPHGHEYTKENTYHNNGARFCRKCNRNRTPLKIVVKILGSAT
jgi:hypothetical protein